MNIPLELGRSFAKRGLRPIAGFGIVGLVVAGFVQLPTSDSQRVDLAIAQELDVPLFTTGRYHRKLAARSLSYHH